MQEGMHTDLYSTKIDIITVKFLCHKSLSL